jgi:DNA ligase-1
MRAFAALLDRLSLTASRNAKLRLIRDHLADTPDPDRGWALAALTGALTFTAAKPAMIRRAVEARVDPELFRLSYDYVGDLAETVALIWPAHHGANREPDLSEVIDALMQARRDDVQGLLEGWLDALDADGRWALLKLVTGGLRVGVSARLAWQAAADFGGVEVPDIQEVWHAQVPPMPISSPGWTAGPSVPRPMPTAASGRSCWPSRSTRGRWRSWTPSPMPPNGNGTASGCRPSVRAG